jgi:hypothetical protein
MPVRIESGSPGLHHRSIALSNFRKLNQMVFLMGTGNHSLVALHYNTQILQWWKAGR